MLAWQHPEMNRYIFLALYFENSSGFVVHVVQWNYHTLTFSTLLFIHARRALHTYAAQDALSAPRFSMKPTLIDNALHMLAHSIILHSLPWGKNVHCCISLKAEMHWDALQEHSSSSCFWHCKLLNLCTTHRNLTLASGSCFRRICICICICTCFVFVICFCICIFVQSVHIAP